MSIVEIGREVKDFSLAATGNQNISLSQLKGKKLILYFYPKDNTSGCTTEGQDFSEHHEGFLSHNCTILGVSRDSVKKHENFKAKYAFPFDLLADTEEKLCQQFDVIKLKKLYGKEYMGIERSTFLMNEHAELIQEWRGVRVKNHVKNVFDAVKALSK